MKSIGLYKESKTIVHDLHPLDKLLYIIVVILLPIIWGNREIAGGCILVSIILLIIGKVLYRAVPIISFSLFLIVTVIIIQGLFFVKNQTIIYRIGALNFYKEGVFRGIGIGLNIINLILAFTILVLTTRPSDLIESLVKIGLSPKMGYVLNSIFQIVPQMSATMTTILDAQRSRGLEVEGNIFRRIKAFLPLIIPVVMNALVNTKERAIALEVRGFNSNLPKSFLNAHVATKKDYVFGCVLCSIVVLSLFGRSLLWHGL